MKHELSNIIQSEVADFFAGFVEIHTELGGPNSIEEAQTQLSDRLCALRAAHEQEPVAITTEQQRVIKMLLNVCGAAFELADDSCQQEVDGESCHVIPDASFVKLSDALDEIENTLPDEYADLPNTVLQWAAVPRHALRTLLQPHPAPSIPAAVPECYQRLLSHAYGMSFGHDWNKGTHAGFHREKLCQAVKDCRAAMLRAEPVSQPYRLPDGYVLVSADFIDTVKQAFKEVGDRKSFPRHSHDVPGVWDSDNGEKANKPCAQCALWSKLHDMLAAAPKSSYFRENENSSTKCWCRTCRPVSLGDMRFVVCPDCGNKRCPKANDHRNVCSGSNEPGQEGSAYPAAPKGV